MLQRLRLGLLCRGPSLLKVEMQIVESSDLQCLKCFGPSSSSEFSLSSAEVEELKKYPNLFKAVHLAMTLPVSSATCERSFSAMRRVQNYVRTTMNEERLLSLPLQYIERGVLSSITVHDIVVQCASDSTRRLLFY